MCCALVAAGLAVFVAMLCVVDGRGQLNHH